MAERAAKKYEDMSDEELLSAAYASMSDEELVALAKEKGVNPSQESSLSEEDQMELKKRKGEPPSEEELRQKVLEQGQFVGDQEKSEQLETFGRSAASSATLGLSEPAISAGVAAARTGMLGPQVPPNLESTDEFSGVYKEDVERRRALEQTHKGAALAGALTGAVVPGTPSAALFGKAMQVGQKAAPMIPGVARMGEFGKTVTGGATGALAYSGVNNAVLENSGFREPGEGASLGESGLMGAGLSAAPGVIGAAGKVAGKVGKGVMSAAFGVKGSAITHYLENAARIEAAPSMDEVKSLIKEGTAAAKVALSESAEEMQTGLSQIKARMSSMRQEAIDILERHNVSLPLNEVKKIVSSVRASLPKTKSGEYAKESARHASSKLDEYEAFLDGLKSDTLRQEAINILERHNVSLPLYEVKTIVSSVRASLPKIKSGEYAKESARHASSKLDEYEAFLDGLKSDTLSGSDLKYVVEDLWERADFLKNSAQFDSSLANRALKQVGHLLDERLKKGLAPPEYGELMQRSHNLAALLDDTAGMIGTSAKAFDTFSRINRLENPIKEKRLKQVVKEANVDFERVRQAQEMMNAFKGLSDKSLERKILSVSDPRNAELRKVMANLAEETEEGLLKTIDDLNNRTQFEKEFFHGSSNVNLWGTLGAMVGFHSHQATAIGAAIGAVAGRTNDKFGPRIALQILRGYSKIQGVVTMRKVRQAFADLPESVRKDITQSFQRTILTGHRESKAIYMDPSLRADYRKEIELSDALNSSEKAKELSSLAKTGESHFLGRVAIGTEKEPIDPPGLKPRAKEVKPKDIIKNSANFFNQKKEEEF